MIDIEARNDDVILAGSLWQPTATPRALLVMHPGSGPSDRDNDVLFPPIREHLLASGIAVASFDKRGVGESTGSWLKADIPSQATDLAVSVAAAQDQLAGVPTGLFGHSQGGWVVLEAANRTAAKFVITNSGPGVSPRVQEEFSTDNQLRVRGASDQRTADAAALFASIMDWLSEGVRFDTANSRLRDPDRAAALEVLVDAGAFVPQDEALWNFAATIIDYDPVRALSELRVPLLALFGGDDTVVPVDASAVRFRGSCPDELLTLRVFPGGDHRIQIAGEAFVADYLAAIVDFILSTVG